MDHGCEVEEKKTRVGRGGGKDIWTYDDGWAKSHTFHHDMELVALLDGGLIWDDLKGFDEFL